MRYAYYGNWAASVLAWDEILRAAPEYAPGYYWRGKSYFLLTQDLTSMSEYEEYVRLGLQDADRAVLLDGGITGDYYHLRGSLYLSRASIEEFRTPLEYYSGIAVDNLERAQAAGAQDPRATLGLSSAMLYAGRCEEALAEARRQQAAIGLKDDPSGSILSDIAIAQLCLGNYSQALTYIDRALARAQDSDWLMTKAEILLGLGRLSDALEFLDALIAAKPGYSGRRYYLRALIHYDLHDSELAQSDLEMGNRNTWGRYAEAALVRGLLARDNGDTQGAIAEFQMAEASLLSFMRPSLQRARTELARLGGDPWPDEGGQWIEATQMPTPTPGPDLRPVIVPPAGIRVDYDLGTGEILLAPGGCLTYRFTAPSVGEVRGADWLTIWILPVSGMPIEGLRLYVWKPIDHLWARYNYRDFILEPPQPERFVLPSGDVVLAACAAEGNVSLSGIMLSAGLRLADGSQVTVGTRPTNP